MVPRLLQRGLAVKVDEVVQAFLVADLVLGKHDPRSLVRECAGGHWDVVSDSRMPVDLMAMGSSTGSIVVMQI